MRFVVCTHSYLLLVDVNDDFVVTGVKALDQDYYDGADVFADGTIIGCAKMEPWNKASPSKFKFFDANGWIPVPPIDGSDVLDPHQCTLTPDQRALWCQSTATNEIVLKSLRDSQRDLRWRMNTPNGGDYNHLNSVCQLDDSVWIGFHNLARQPSSIEHYTFDGMTLEHLGGIILPHWSIHNIETEDGVVFHYNASDNGRVMRYHGDTFEEAMVGREWHPKGMTLLPDYVVSGFSEHAVSTPRRFISESGLAFVDRNTWDVVAMPRIEYNGRLIGNINEVRWYERPRLQGRPRGNTRADGARSSERVPAAVS